MKLRDQIVGEFATGLRQRTEAWQVEAFEMQSPQHLVRVRHSGERVAAGSADERPAFLRHEAFASERQPAACHQMSVHYREPVRVMHRKASDGTVVPAD